LTDESAGRTYLHFLSPMTQICKFRVDFVRVTFLNDRSSEHPSLLRARPPQVSPRGDATILTSIGKHEYIPKNIWLKPLTASRAGTLAPLSRRHNKARNHCQDGALLRWWVCPIGAGSDAAPSLLQKITKPAFNLRLNTYR
jgi:hypothetical protein